MIIPSHSAIINVTSNRDDGTGCTLREAIISANTSVNQNNGCAIGSNSGTDTITFSNSLTSNTITLDNRSLVVDSNQDLDIDASEIDAGITIDANKGSRIFSQGNGSNLRINNLTLTGGLVSGGGGEADGGAIAAYSATLTLVSTTISGNTAFRRGGGIYSKSSTLNLYDSSVDNNFITGGESTGARGGGIAAETSGSINIHNSTISSNTAFRIGGISANSVNLTLTNSVMTANTATEASNADGGAIFSRGQVSLNVIGSTLTDNFSPDGGAIFASSGPTVTINNSTISGNSASRGGGIVTFGYSGNAATTMTISNSTISGNTASGIGGGIAIYGAQVSLNHSTLAENAASNGGGAIDWSDGFSDTGALILRNSILADSNGQDCSNLFNSVPVDVDSATIIEDGSCSAVRSGDPALQPLADNGGPTQTHALREVSIARNSSTGTCLSTDQRGQARNISDGSCDVGAFEFIENLDNLDDSSFFVVPLKNGRTVIFNL